MKAGHCCAFALLGASTLAGCRQDPARELLERDLRIQEDKIYHLKSHLNEMAASLEACRRENEALKAGGRIETSPGDLPGPSSPRTRSAPPSSAPPADPLQPPEVIPGVEVPPVIEGVPKIDAETQLDSAPLELDVPSDESGPRFFPASKPMAEGESSDVETITLNKRLTGSYNADAKGGDEGLTVLIEPRDTEGNILKASADVSVVLIDPAGGGTRVARWDFLNDEIVNKFQQTVIGRGIYLRLLWPNEAPASGDYKMHVRYTTVDGRRLDVSRDIVVRSQPTGAQPAELEPHTAGTPSTLRSAMRDSLGSEISLSSKKNAPAKPSWSPYR